MFGGSYFGNSYFGPTYFGPGVIITGGGKVKEKLPRAKTEEEKEDLINGLKAFYGETETKEEKEQEFETKVETIIESEDFGELETISDEYEEELEFQRSLDLLEAVADVDESTRDHLKAEQDIGLILAIIEAID